MTIRYRNVERSGPGRIEKLASESKHIEAGIIEISISRAVFKIVLGRLQVQRICVLVEVGGEQIQQTILIQICNGNPHCCLCLSIPVVSDTTDRRFFCIGWRTILRDA